MQTAIPNREGCWMRGNGSKRGRRRRRRPLQIRTVNPATNEHRRESRNNGGIRNADEHLEKRFLTKRELAEYIGMSEYTIDSWVSERREVPFVRMGRRVKFDMRDVEKWVEHSKKMYKLLSEQLKQDPDNIEVEDRLEYFKSVIEGWGKGMIGL